MDRFTLPALPYEEGSWPAFLSPETFEFHHGKHHATYVKNLNDLLAKAPALNYSNPSLEQIIHMAYQAKNQAVFNNAAQVWNHTFYWGSMTGNPERSNFFACSQAFQSVICDAFGGSYEEFLKTFKQSALCQFGSGWTWLVCDSLGRLHIENTSNADLPFVRSKIPLLTCDVWEHAYYIDFRNNRGSYVDAFLTSIDWKRVEERYENQQPIATQESFLS